MKQRFVTPFICSGQQSPTCSEWFWQCRYPKFEGMDTHSPFRSITFRKAYVRFSRVFTRLFEPVSDYVQSFFLKSMSYQFILEAIPSYCALWCFCRADKRSTVEDNLDPGGGTGYPSWNLKPRRLGETIVLLKIGSAKARPIFRRKLVVLGRVNLSETVLHFSILI